jgi:hypothetical protein
MKKPKSKTKQLADLKRGAKRNKRLKDSRKKVAAKRAAAIEKRKAEKAKFLEFMKKLEEARARGEF